MAENKLSVGLTIGQPATGLLARKGVEQDLILRQQNYLLTNYFRGDPLNLSTRITQLKLQEEVAESLRVSMKNISGLYNLADEISQYTNEQDIAKWIRRIESQARKVIADGDPALLKTFQGEMTAAKRGLLDGLEYKNMSKLNKAYYKVLSAAEKLSDTGLDIAIDNALEKKALSNAFRIAHTEIRRAYNTGVYSRSLQDEDVEAFRIELSAAGNNCEDCIEIAEADNGAGPGIYPVDEVPRIPLHPHCRCELTPVYALPKGMDGEDIETDYEGETMKAAPDDVIGQ